MCENFGNLKKKKNELYVEAIYVSLYYSYCATVKTTVAPGQLYTTAIVYLVKDYRSTWPTLYYCHRVSRKGLP